jgi:magnesium transporter
VAAANPAIERDSPFLFFSSLIKKPIREEGSGRFVGRVADLTARPEEMYPRVRDVLVSPGRGRSLVRLPWDRVVERTNREIRVRAGATESLQPAQPAEGEMLLRDEFLDRQIVDIGGAKIVRVNDLHLLEANHALWLVHMDIGTRGLLRRLGFERRASAAIRWLFDYDLPNRFISWKYVQPLPSSSPANHGSMKLTIPQKRLVELHPADLADILEELNARERQAMMAALPLETAAEALENAEPEVQKSVIEEIHEEKAADILEEMSPTEAADILGDLTDEKAENILDAMEPSQAEDVRELLEHGEDTAGGLMTTSFLSLPPDETVEHALDLVRKRAGEVDVYSYVYVVSPDEHLLGVVNLRELLGAPPQAPLDKIATRKVVTVDPVQSPREVAKLFAKYAFRAIPVVGPEGKLEGVIRFRNLVEAVAPHLEA